MMVKTLEWGAVVVWFAVDGRARCRRSAVCVCVCVCVRERLCVCDSMTDDGVDR